MSAVHWELGAGSWRSTQHWPARTGRHEIGRARGLAGISSPRVCVCGRLMILIGKFTNLTRLIPSSGRPCEPNWTSALHHYRPTDQLINESNQSGRSNPLRWLWASAAELALALEMARSWLSAGHSSFAKVCPPGLTDAHRRTPHELLVSRS